jgi:phosphoglycolate phosphatase-like HAD superfamily hydrolase
MGSPPTTRAVVFDFDGTLTDPRPTAALFAERFYGYLLEARPDAGLLVERRLCDERGAPELWSNDVIVARGTADPWLGATSVARAALTELLGPGEQSAVESIVSTAFHRAYDEVRAPFREGVCSLFGALIDRSISVNVVSNSPKDRVLARLLTAGLSDAQLARVTVVGGAQKFVVAAAESARAKAWLAATGEARVFESAPRAVTLRRGRYLDAIASICDRVGCDGPELAACGDVFELDLAVPLSIGARVCMVAHEGARPWEAGAVARSGGFVNEHALPSIEQLVR